MLANDAVGRRSVLKGAGAALLAVGSAGLVAACTDSSSGPKQSPGASGSGVPQRGGQLRAGITGGAMDDSISIFTPGSNTNIARVVALHDPLVYFDSNAQLQYRLATEMTPSSDVRTWTIHLREDVEFHDGKSMTADDVIYTLQQIGLPANNAYGASNLAIVDLANLKKMDPYTVEVPLKAPSSIFNYSIASFQFCVIPVGYDPSNPVGTGAFKYKSFTPGVESTFVRNPNYWNNNEPYVDELVITNFADEVSQTNALVGGQVDVVQGLSSASVQAVESGGAKLVISDGGALYSLGMRVDVKPFDDVRVRQALKLIVDRDQMLEQVFLGNGTIGNDVFSPWDPQGNSDLPQREQDIDQARSLLKQAGYDNDLQIELTISGTSAGDQTSAEVFAQQAKDAGVDVKINKVSEEVFNNGYPNWDFSIVFASYRPYVPTVSLVTKSDAPFNTTHFQDAAYDELYSEVIATVDTNEQTELIHEMQQIDYDQGGNLIPFFPPVIDGTSTRVHGLAESKLGVPLNAYGFREMWLA